MYYLAMGLYVFICFLLLVVVLLQQGKGGDIAAAFGGSSSQTAFGARAGATFLTRATAVLATLFLLGAFALGVMGRSEGGGSVVSGVKGPARGSGRGEPADGRRGDADANATGCHASRDAAPTGTKPPAADAKKPGGGRGQWQLTNGTGG